MRSRETGDAYASAEPQNAFHKRITFCLDVHNEAVKAMRYPANAYKKDLESAQRKVRGRMVNDSTSMFRLINSGRASAGN